MERSKTDAPDDEYYMRIALEEADRGGAEGNDAIGSGVVKDGSLAALGRNLTSSTQDPTAHPETVCLRNAGATLGLADLTGGVLYTTFQPCPMCCVAIMVSGITKVVISAGPDPSLRRFGPYTMEAFLKWSEWENRIEVVADVLAQECLQLRQKWQADRGA